MQPQQPQERPAAQPQPPQPIYPSPPAGPTPPPDTYGQPAPAPGGPQYDFIMKSDKAAGKSKLPSVSNYSGPVKAGLALGALVLVFILFSVFRAIFGGGPDLSPFVTIAQEQQALTHITSQALEQRDLSTTNKNFAITAQLSLNTSRTKLLQYLDTNGKKVDPKTLNLKVNPKTDEQLKSAAGATTYNQTFKQVMNDKLNTYMKDMRQAYDQTSGKNGRQLLGNDYDQAGLLLEQLNSSGQ